jgi:hypothetical protein
MRDDLGRMYLIQTISAYVPQNFTLQQINKSVNLEYKVLEKFTSTFIVIFT